MWRCDTETRETQGRLEEDTDKANNGGYVEGCRVVLFVCALPSRASLAVHTCSRRK